MISPTEKLLDAMEILLRDGRGDYGLPPVLDPDDGIPIYRGDALATCDSPLVIIAQVGPAKERHKQGSGLWEIPVSAKYIFDRNGETGDSQSTIADILRIASDDLEAVLTQPLLVDADEPEGDQSTPEQRLTTDDLHVWEIFDVLVEMDTEMEGDPTCEVKFTAFCGYSTMIIPEA